MNHPNLILIGNDDFTLNNVRYVIRIFKNKFTNKIIRENSSVYKQIINGTYMDNFIVNDSYNEVDSDNDYETDSDEDEDEEFEVQRIITSRINNDRVEYLVQWIGYEERTWEPVGNLENARNILQDFHENVLFNR